MVSSKELARIAEIEFADIVDSTEMIGTKLRVMLIKDGFIDVWLSRKLEGRFGFHWEQEFDQELVLEKQVNVYKRLVEERCP